MSSANKNLSEYDASQLPDGSAMRFGIVTSKWNTEITGALRTACLQTLQSANVNTKNIVEMEVPGSFELTTGASWLLQSGEVDCVICLGCVIQGETRHFDFICNAISNGLTKLSINYGKAVIFGVLTPNNMQQAQDRAGGKHGNKGIEAATTALQMVQLYNTEIQRRRDNFQNYLDHGKNM